MSGENNLPINGNKFHIIYYINAIEKTFIKKQLTIQEKIIVELAEGTLDTCFVYTLNLTQRTLNLDDRFYAFPKSL